MLKNFDALREEGNDAMKFPGNRADCLKRRRRERQFDGDGEVLIILYTECTYSLFLPFYGQPARFNEGGYLERAAHTVLNPRSSWRLYSHVIRERHED